MHYSMRRAHYVLIVKRIKSSLLSVIAIHMKYDRQGPIASFHTDNCPLGVFLGTLQKAFNFGTLVRLTHLSWRAFLSMKKS